MENDTILSDKSEEKLMKLLDVTQNEDFWSAYKYLTEQVRISELQAFSVCIRKYDYKGMKDVNQYTHVGYNMTHNHYYNPFEPMTFATYTLYNLNDLLTIIFIKKISVPTHLQKICSMFQRNIYPLERLSYNKKITGEIKLEIKDSFLISILRKLFNITTEIGTLITDESYQPR